MEFNVSNRVIRCTNPQSVIGDNSDLPAHFTLDEEWTGKEVTARFESTRSNEYRDTLLDSEGTCTIPVEVLKKGLIRVGVFSSEMTSTYCEVEVVASIKEKNGRPITPTMDIYAQIITRIEEIAHQVVPQEQIEAAVEEYLEEHPIETLTEEDVIRIVTAYVTEHHDELKGDPGEAGPAGPQGPNGADGEDGEDGVSITGVAIDSNNHLIVTLSDGTSRDAGALPSGGATIDDSTTALDKTWSSSKVADYVDTAIGGALNGSY